ncbi:hypothetical protein EJ05DRAFT_482774 [Pseudovirgaria hyperparasitica]|uniref:Complex 1 LYR protein domain-containing protein n=1 Tax=Pseudovirgaria hyperparasitica TaxID=470096 RepID=A0A6A6WGI8_9PEZI|nr:uncharacterized protein EJ05DRAFT_482774 [Pseudovirgaria hyperparasitica]KAF2761972.1 hypothetical protein EJ05DRAFT_482774 [Pseudovirgaria hyperparasitica]
MPSYIQFCQSGEHRSAVIALFRALLKQCRAAPIPELDRIALQHVVRHGFRKNKKANSNHQLRYAFLAGYEGLDRLDAASSGCPAAIDSTLQLIEKIHPKLKTPMLQKPKKVKDLAKSVQPRAPLPKGQQEHDVRPRPFESFNGPRNVPTLVAAGSDMLTFIQFKKPQPPSLSRAIRYQQLYKLEIINTRIALRDWHIPLAEQEDLWEHNLRQISGLRSTDPFDNIQYNKVMRHYDHLLVQELAAFHSRHMAHRDRLKAIIEEESRLAKEEQAAYPDMPVRVRKDRAKRRLIPAEIHDSQKMWVQRVGRSRRIKLF